MHSTPFSGIRAAIIDLDGTMLDTAPDFLVALNAMRAELGLSDINLATVKLFVGKGTENLIDRVLAMDMSENESAKHFDAALASYQQHYQQINGQLSTFYPEVMTGLQAFKDKGIRLACVTNKPLALTLPLLKMKGLTPFFDAIYGGDSFAKKKPDPFPLLQVCKDFDLNPSQVLAIGDSSNDALAARRAGCPIILVPYGYNHGETIQSVESDGIVANLLEASRLI